MSQELSSNVQRWVALDNELRSVQENAKQIRDRRNQIGGSILEYVDANGLGNATVKISDGKLRFIESRQPQSLTLRYVEDCLGKCIANHEDVAKIMRVIKESREIRTTPDIKRTYAKGD